MGKVKAEMTVMTPSRAAELLLCNRNNRSVSSRLVTRYARDMASGNWQTNGSAVVLNGDGSLLDGQHRLMACVEADVPFTTLLIRGVGTDAMATIDTGRSRKLSDVLTMRGEERAKTLASVLRYSIIWGHVGPGEIPMRAAGWNPSHSELLDFLERYPEARDVTVIADRSRPRGMVGSIVGAMALNLIVAIDDAAYIDQFFRALMQGDGDQSSPPYSLWHSIAKWSAETNNKRESSYLLALMVKAWNASVAGEMPSIWRWRRAGSHAEAFPTILDLDGQPIALVK